LTHLSTVLAAPVPQLPTLSLANCSQGLYSVK
jgi:hypothetical protein